MASGGRAGAGVSRTAWASRSIGSRSAARSGYCATTDSMLRPARTWSQAALNTSSARELRSNMPIYVPSGGQLSLGICAAGQHAPERLHPAIIQALHGWHAAVQKLGNLRQLPSLDHMQENDLALFLRQQRQPGDQLLPIGQIEKLRVQAAGFLAGIDFQPG